MVKELTAGHVGTGSAWKLYTCCAAATLVSGTRVAPGLHPGTPTGVKVFTVLSPLGCMLGQSGLGRFLSAIAPICQNRLHHAQ